MATPVGPVVYGVEVNGISISDFPIDVELRQAWGMHDLFLLRIEYNRTYLGIHNMSLWPDNAPVKIIWGRRPNNIQTWYGYVNHHNISANADSGSTALQILYCCIGTSKMMNTDKSRQWGEVTPTYIARKIASEYGLRSVLTSTDWVLPYEVQANESDFCFLNRIAGKVGFRFWVSGATLYFIEPSVILSGSNRLAVPSFRLDKLFSQTDTVRQFCMNEGDNLPGAAIAHRTVYGIDKSSGQIFQSTATTANNPLITEIKTDRNVSSINEAQNIVQAWESMNQWWISASAELFGDVALYPGKIIYLDGLQMPQNSRGYWIVASVTHVLKSSRVSYTKESRYISQVELLRNSSSLTPTIKNTATVNPEIMDCILKPGNKWAATAATVMYDGVLSV